MPFPKTDKDLVAAGYEFDNKAKCRGCQADIEWWRTPKGKSIPLDAGTLEPHWGTCPKAKDFRKQEPAQKAYPRPGRYERYGPR